MIFNKSFLKDEHFTELYKKLKYYDSLYKNVFDEKLKETPIYVFASPNNQISNAITTSIPFLRVIFFPTGVDRVADLSIVSWADTVIAHELAHIYQLGQISDHLTHFRAIFKNSEIIFVPFPVFLNVNMVMPLIFLEGHAVLSESILAPGGRLYSGRTRAMVFSQLKHQYKNTKQFMTNYLLNITNRNFSLSEKYNHGAYFFSSLLEDYSFKKINEFFKNHAEHFIIPLAVIAVKKAFQKTFHNSFENLAHRYIHRYLPLAKKQKQASGNIVFRSSVCPSFNRKGDEVFFLTADLKSTPTLRTYHKQTNKWTDKRKAFAIGKLFQIDKKYYVSAGHNIHPRKIAYSLFSDGMYLFDTKYLSQSMQDIYQDHWLSIDTTNNMDQFRLLLDGKFYDETHSEALFDPFGSVYYFKQKKDWRVLFKDKRELFRFKGFYSKLMGIDESGTVYFVAASLLGSSLFAWSKDRGMMRVSDSDVIIEATQVQGDKWFICELELDSYVYKWITLKPKKSKPVLYKYAWEKRRADALPAPLSKPVNISHSRTISSTNKQQKTPSTNIVSPSTLKHRVYHPFTRIHFNGVEVGWFYDPITKYNILAGVGFRDFLEYNTMQLFYQVSRDNWVFQSEYSNNQHRIPWGIQYSYKQGLENFFGARAFSYIHELSNYVHIPLLRKGYWSSNLQLRGAISSLRVRSLQGRTHYFSVSPAWRIQYKRKYRNNFIAHRDFYLDISTQYHAPMSLDDSNFLWNIYSYYTFHVGSDFYMKPFISYRSAKKQKSIPFRYLGPLGLIQKPEIDLFLRKRELLQTNNYFFTGITNKKVLNTPLYFAWFPFSLMRVAPLVHIKYMQYLDNDEAKKKQLLEWIVGADVEILVHHKIPFTLSIYYGASQKDSLLNFKQSSSLFGFRLHSSI